MGKLGKKWLIVDWNDPDCIRAQDIPYNDTESIQDRTERILDEGLWQVESASIAYASSTSFTVSGDKTSVYKPGRALRVTQTTNGLGYVETSTYDNVSGNTTVVITGLSIDSGLTKVEYGLFNDNIPYGIAETFSKNKIPVAGTNGLDKSWIAYLMQKQGHLNLMRNGNFETWSAGVTNSPDYWTSLTGTTSVVQGNDGSIGSNYATYTSNGDGINSAGIRQIHSLLSPWWLNIAIALKLTLTFGINVRSSVPLNAYFWVSGVTPSVVYGDAHPADGAWHTLWGTYTFTGVETGFESGILLASNTVSQSFDIAQARLYQGELKFPFEQNPEDMTTAGGIVQNDLIRWF